MVNSCSSENRRRGRICDNLYVSLSNGQKKNYCRKICRPTEKGYIISQSKGKSSKNTGVGKYAVRPSQLFRAIRKPDVISMINCCLCIKEIFIHCHVIFIAHTWIISRDAQASRRISHTKMCTNKNYLFALFRLSLFILLSY